MSYKDLIDRYWKAFVIPSNEKKKLKGISFDDLFMALCVLLKVDFDELIKITKEISKERRR